MLAKAGRGLAGKSHWSDLLYKALKQDDALTLPRGESMPTGVVDGFIRFAWTGGNNNMDSLDITGNSFDFKNRLTKADETICVEYKTFEQKDSSNDYNLKVTFDNGKILYVTAALVGTGLSYANQDNTDSRIYRLSDLV